jgi:hypothetical protein
VDNSQGLKNACNLSLVVALQSTRILLIICTSYPTIVSSRYQFWAYVLLQIVEAPGWSNGRDVGNLVKRTFRAYAVAAQASAMVGMYTTISLSI